MANIDWTARDANGNRSLSVDMSNVTGGTVGVLHPGGTQILHVGSGITQFDWPDNTTIVIQSSSGKKVTLVNRASPTVTPDDSGVGGDAAGPDLSY